MRDDRSRYIKIMDGVLLWLSTVALVSSIALYFLMTQAALNKPHHWTFMLRLQNAGGVTLFFISGWLWREYTQRRRYRKYIDRVVENSQEWYDKRAAQK